MQLIAAEPNNGRQTFVMIVFEKQLLPVQFGLVTQSCLALCDPMDCSMPGLPVITNFRSLLKLMSIELVMPSNYFILCHHLLFLPQSFPVSESLQTSHLFASGGQSIGVSASTSVLPMNTQD